ncbi:radical SAM protein [Desulfofustis limnaeus]|jgi:radical SAM superfamily enzyme YgiQ (UPF0313 family)|uniref:Radical SAM protein n=1 Tax=Desulfofustis limnaeus TaxID=2740163 RepID=A0ABN6M5L1_9BACT|nr:radical SAM protein [Desulfofustis limnaeus]BDD87210.1 radical SAM protein [Desulfofustis limnaeus]
MHYEGIVIRPPSEANSIILQVCVGCPHNRCTFCGAYREVRFRVKSEAEIDADLDFAARYCHKQHRVFLADGDALHLPQHYLEQLLKRITQRLSWVNRVSLYASARSIRTKSDEDLQRLRQLGLDRVYLGLESGDDAVLAAVAKGETARSLEESGRRVVAAGLFLSATIILGLAGVAGSARHAQLTAELVNRMRPHQLAALTLLLLDNTPLGRAAAAGRFHLPNAPAMLQELQALLAALEVERMQFMANHASNYLPLSGRLPRDKEKLLTMIRAALDGSVQLVPEHRRAL